ncbi:MAG: RNA polymerase sigma factor [Burkholderiales bacterium]
MIPTTEPVAGLPTENDADLAQRIAAGDTAAFEVLMRRYNRMLYRAARALLHSDADAEDALQTAYLHAFRAMPDFRGEARLSTWLARIVINESIARQRRYAAENKVIPLDAAADADGELPVPPDAAAEDNAPELSAMRSETRALIERKIDMLPEQFRTVFVLRAIEELSVEETASWLRIPQATVRSRFFRARSLLRESLARELDAALDSAFAFDGARCDRIVSMVMRELLAPDSPAPPDG